MSLSGTLSLSLSLFVSLFFGSTRRRLVTGGECSDKTDGQNKSNKESGETENTAR